MYAQTFHDPSGADRRHDASSAEPVLEKGAIGMSDSKPGMGAAKGADAEPASTPKQETPPPAESPTRESPSGSGSRGSGSSHSGTATAVRPAPARPTPDVLPPWRVVLHNDDHNDMDHVVETIIRVVRLNRPSATRCMVEAHRKGLCQVIATHRERAEFLAEQLRSCQLTVTIEPVR